MRPHRLLPELWAIILADPFDRACLALTCREERDLSAKEWKGPLKTRQIACEAVSRGYKHWLAWWFEEVYVVFGARLECYKELFMETALRAAKIGRPDLWHLVATYDPPTFDDWRRLRNEVLWQNPMNYPIESIAGLHAVLRIPCMTIARYARRAPAEKFLHGLTSHAPDDIAEHFARACLLSDDHRAMIVLQLIHAFLRTDLYRAADYVWRSQWKDYAASCNRALKRFRQTAVPRQPGAARPLLHDGDVLSYEMIRQMPDPWPHRIEQQREQERLAKQKQEEEERRVLFTQLDDMHLLRLARARRRDDNDDDGGNDGDEEEDDLFGDDD
jgi:hypothetical protein